MPVGQIRKTRTFTVPSRGPLMFAFFNIAMDDPLFVRCRENLGYLSCNRHSLVDRYRTPCAMRSARVGPSTSSITSAVVPRNSLFQTIDGCYDRKVERRQTLALHAETLSQSVGIPRRLIQGGF